MRTVGYRSESPVSNVSISFAPQDISIMAEDDFCKRVNEEAEKDNKAQLTSLSGLTQRKSLPKVMAKVFIEINKVAQEQPNFKAVTDQIVNTLYAQCLSGMAATIPPMLLYGAPGVGKTRYFKRIAKALGLPFCDIPLAGSPDAFKITGLSRYWGTAGPGMVARTFADSPAANPIFLLDEIDKVKASDNGDPLSRVLLLLEKESAETFMDDFIMVPMNVSYASFMATANSIEHLPSPLLSRFICIEIPALDLAGRETMVETVYREMRDDLPFGKFLSSVLPDEARKVLAMNEGLGGRELKREILQAMQRACRDIPIGGQPTASVEVTAEHLQLPKATQPRRIGFI